MNTDNHNITHTIIDSRLAGLENRISDLEEQLELERKTVSSVEAALSLKTLLLSEIVYGDIIPKMNFDISIDEIHKQAAQRIVNSVEDLMDRLREKG